MRRRWWVLPIAVVLLAGCGDDGGGEEVAVVSATVDANDTTLNFVLDSCHTTQQQAEVAESATEVRVTVTVQGDTDEDCNDAMTVQLTQPLEDRDLIDATTDEAIPIEES